VLKIRPFFPPCRYFVMLRLGHYCKIFFSTKTPPQKIETTLVFFFFFLVVKHKLHFEIRQDGGGQLKKRQLNIFKRDKSAKN